MHILWLVCFGKLHQTHNREVTTFSKSMMYSLLLYPTKMIIVSATTIFFNAFVTHFATNARNTRNKLLHYRVTKWVKTTFIFMKYTEICSILDKQKYYLSMLWIGTQPYRFLSLWILKCVFIVFLISFLLTPTPSLFIPYSPHLIIDLVYSCLLIGSMLCLYNTD